MQCPSSPSSSSASTAEMMKVFQAKVHQLNGSKIADESDFDGHTGKVKSNKIVVLDEEKAIQTARWLTGNLSSSSHHVNFIVHDKTERKTHRSAPLPFITSSLQQDASQKLGFSPTRTMSVAQKLYENGYITYMRTDSPTLSQQALAIAKETVKQRYGEEYLDSFGEGEGKGYGHKQGSSTNKMKNPPKNAQEAHEAIRPATTDSNQFRDPEEVMRSSALELDEKRLYDLIYKRTIASVMKSSQSITTTLTIHAKDDVEGSKYNSNKDHSHDDHSSWSAVLKSSETFMEFPGYSIVYQGRGNKGKERSRSKLLFEKIGIGDRLLLAQTNDNHGGRWFG
jgi:DNA topoisomerase-1